MSLVSKPYVLDLRPGNSFVEALLSRGFDVYMLDWGIPDATESENSFETYCDEYIPLACASAIARAASTRSTCSATASEGVLSLIFAAGHPEIPLRTLSLLAAPIDFAAMGGMTALLRQGRLDPADLIDETGNVPAETMLPRRLHERASRVTWRRTRRCSRTSRTASTSPLTKRCTDGPPITSRSRAPASARWCSG